MKNLHINIFLYLLTILIFIYKVEYPDFSLYFNQYDIFGNLNDIHKNYQILIKKFNISEVNIYHIRALLIIIFNLFCLNLLLNSFNLKLWGRLFVLIVFISLPNLSMRYSYGHDTLMYYGQFFLSVFFFHQKQSFKLFKLAPYGLIFFTFFIHEQIFIYHVLLNLFLMYTYNHQRELIYNCIIITILIIIYFSFYSKIIFFLSLKTSVYELDYVNKYSLNNIFELFFINKELYMNLLTNLKSNLLNSYINKFDEYLLYYNFNGPENIHFYGVTSIFIFIYNFYNKNSKSLTIYSFLLFLILIFISSNRFYYFSLINLNHLLFPYVRAVGRIMIIFDVIFILNLIYFYKYNQLFYFKHILILFLIFEMNKFDNFSIKTDLNKNNLSKYNGKAKINYDKSLKTEHYYIYEFLMNRGYFNLCEVCKYELNLKKNFYNKKKSYLNLSDFLE